MKKTKQMLYVCLVVPVQQETLVQQNSGGG